MPKYRAHLEFDAPADTTAWMMAQRFARNAGRECVLVNVESERSYFTDVAIEDVRTARAGVAKTDEIPF